MNPVISDISVLIGLPIIAGIILFILPEKVRLIKGVVALLVSGVVVFFAFRLYFSGSVSARISLFEPDS
jgi:Mn2+/Fe2+ NRAMP family transporter